MTDQQMHDACTELIKLYEVSKRKDDAEPKWILHPFDMVYECIEKGIDSLEDDWKENLEDIINSMNVKDHTVHKEFPFPKRVIHNGFKVGTTSWVYMNRANSTITKIRTGPKFYYEEDLYVVSRTIPPSVWKMLKKPHPELTPEVFCAYSLNPKINLDVGPCISLDHIKNVVSGGNQFTITSM